MADNQDNLSAKDQKMLEDLEKQLTQSAQKNTNSGTSGSASKASESVTQEKVMGNKDMPKSTNTKTHKVEPARPAGKAKTGFLWFFTIINLLLLGAVIAGAYWGWMLWQNQQQQQTSFFAQQESVLATQLASAAKQQADLANAIAANQLVKEDWQQQSLAEQERLDVLSAAIQQNKQQIASNLSKVSEIAGRRPADWLLAEANYLLNIAGRKLWLEHDVDTAILMLQAADSRLQDMAEPSLLVVREKLASDISTLQQLNPLATTAIALDISGLGKQVDNLPLTFFKKPENSNSELELSTDDADWYDNLVNSIDHVLAGFFSVKKITTDIKPFMSEQQQWLVKEQVKFSLLSAQTAALQEQWPVFMDAINNALVLVNTHFDGQSLNVSQFIASLQTLLNSDIETNYPQQFAASSAMQDAMDKRLGNRFSNGNN
jgi:uroporphyrin-3 C-methyltransferase